jgi:hypothetical protein
MNEDEFMTRSDFHYKYEVPFSKISDRVRRGKIALHFIDGKIQINVKEALKACEKLHPISRLLSEKERDDFLAEKRKVDLFAS